MSLFKRNMLRGSGNGNSKKGHNRDVVAEVLEVDAKNGKVKVKEGEREYWVMPNPHIHGNAQPNNAYELEGNFIDGRFAKAFEPGTKIIIEQLIDYGVDNDANTENRPMYARWFNSVPAPYKGRDKVDQGPVTVHGAFKETDKGEKVYAPRNIVVWKGVQGPESFDAIAQHLDQAFRKHMATRELTEIAGAIESGDAGQQKLAAQRLAMAYGDDAIANLSGDELKAAFEKFVEEHEVVEKDGRYYMPIDFTPSVSVFVLKDGEVIEADVPVLNHYAFDVDSLSEAPGIKEVVETSLLPEDRVKANLRYAPLGGTSFNAVIQQVLDDAQKAYGENVELRVATGRAYLASKNLENNPRLQKIATMKGVIAPDDGQGKPVVSNFGGNMSVQSVVTLSPGKIEPDRKTGEMVRKGAQNNYANAVYASGSIKPLFEQLGLKAHPELEKAIEAVKEEARQRYENAQPSSDVQDAEPAKASVENSKKSLGAVKSEVDEALEAAEKSMSKSSSLDI